MAVFIAVDSPITVQKVAIDVIASHGSYPEKNIQTLLFATERTNEVHK